MKNGEINNKVNSEFDPSTDFSKWGLEMTVSTSPIGKIFSTKKSGPIMCTLGGFEKKWSTPKKSEKKIFDLKYVSEHSKTIYDKKKFRPKKFYL